MRANELADLVGAIVKLAVADVEARLRVIEGKAMGLESRLVGVETARPMSGPAGPPGPRGEKGTDGKDGRDGANGAPGRDGAVNYKGVFQRGTDYAKGDLVTHDGSLWHANHDLALGTGLAAPGDGSNGWTLVVKRGRDGKDLRDPKEPKP